MVTIDTNAHLPAAPGNMTTLSINHEAMVDLDSTNAFEGPEKLLEVWFVPSPTMLPSSAQPDGLKSVAKETWEEMLDLVRCKVLSVVENEHVDAYLLSESSMFVFPHKVILKTCGTTTLLAGLARLLEIAGTQAGFTKKNNSSLAEVYRVFYSRKAFMFPDRQEHPHKSWKDEVDFMEQIQLQGSAYQVGRMNGEHWYLYVTNANASLTPPHTPLFENMFDDEALFSSPHSFNNRAGATAGESGRGIGGVNDETLEILMTDLDPVKARQFYLEDASAVAKSQYNCESGDIPQELTTEGHQLGGVVSHACGLADIYPLTRFPDACIDSYVFTPCGYSANAVLPSPDKSDPDSYYFTVHVTPEPHCSYASFETNVPRRQCGRNTAEVIESVVEIFRPGRFSVTLFEAKPTATEVLQMDSLEQIAMLKRAARMENLKGYKRVDKIVHDLDGYDLVFRSYERENWKRKEGNVKG